jgi:hypothetical protein
MRLVPILIAIVVVVAITLVPSRAAATGGEGEAWPTFTESSSCGAQRISTPLADHQGWLSTSDILRGEFAAMFGRTVADVFSHLVRWQIPGSSASLAVHERILPAYQRVRNALQSAILSGGRYPIESAATSSVAARTIAGNWRISRHTFGAAVDINAHANPSRSDNVLITDMPPWWVGAFLDAGFCWGGLWIGSKDSMHFAWQGPAFSGYDTLPTPYEPLTDPQRIVLPSRSIPILPPPPDDPIAIILADADSNGAVDVVRIAETPDGLLVDASLASLGHTACSSRKSLVAGLGHIPEDAHTIGMGDWDGRGGQDLWLATDENGRLRLTVRWAFGDFSAETAVTTDIPMPSSEAWISTGDADGDGALDLFVIDGPTLSVWSIDPRSGDTAHITTVPNPLPGAQHYFLGDADLDTLPDMWAVRSGAIDVSLASDGYRDVFSSQRPLGLPGTILDVRAADYDGDGRADLITFDGRNKTVWLANTPLPDGLPPEVWFQYPDAECEDRVPAQNLEDLQFTSNGWVGEGSYAWRSANGFPVGCDPEAAGCVPPVVTARSLAEFFSWIDGLEPVGTDPTTAAPKAIAQVGYSMPCTPGDELCWSRPLLRTEVAHYFGRFLADRRGDVPDPHRWVLPKRDDPLTDRVAH